MAMGKLDIVREDPRYYRAGSRPEIAEFGTNSYLTIEGKSEPGGKEFQDGIDLLFGLCFGLKFHFREKGKDFSVPRLECQWWSGSGKPFYRVGRSEWVWKLMLRVPDYVSAASVASAVKDVSRKREGMHGSLPKLERLKTGKCVQVMHTGPYENEKETGAVIQRFMTEHGLECSGPFHELYLSDPRRTSPERLKTIIRQPVK